MVKRKAETLTQSSPDALEPSTVAQQRKTTRAAPPATLPKMLTYPNKVVPSAIACIAVARCGSDEGQMAAMMMERPVMAATLVFDSIREQDCVDAEQNLGVLLQHFSSVFETLGGSAAAVFDEWSRLHRMVVRDASLWPLPLEELYSRALLHFQHNHFNLLLLMALVQASAMDVVLAECGAPRLLSALKQESAHCRGKMLLFLVGHAWLTVRKQDPSMISLASLVHKWIEASV
jgi:hypothetical protein